MSINLVVLLTNLFQGHVDHNRISLGASAIFLLDLDPSKVSMKKGIIEGCVRHG